MLYLFRGLEDTLRGASAGIADSARAPADKDDGMVAGSWNRFKIMKGIRWPICMLSPVGSIPQYREIDFLSTSLYSPSASVC